MCPGLPVRLGLECAISLGNVSDLRCLVTTGVGVAGECCEIPTTGRCRGRNVWPTAGQKDLSLWTATSGYQQSHTKEPDSSSGSGQSCEAGVASSGGLGRFSGLIRFGQSCRIDFGWDWRGRGGCAGGRRWLRRAQEFFSHHQPHQFRVFTEQRCQLDVEPRRSLGDPHLDSAS
jgi:hypothetical protein